MPKSHQRKDHRQRVTNRNKRIQDEHVHINRVYQALVEQLKAKNTSVPDMLNKEEESKPITLASQSVVPIPDEQIEI